MIRSTGHGIRSIGSLLLVSLLSIVGFVQPVHAQETAAQEAVRQASALANLPKTAARRLFGAVKSPAPGKVNVVGQYWQGCFTGGDRLAPIGEHWQVMRLSRNRNWGTPRLISFLERFAATASKASGWPGILIGDLSQPRGGPMLTGHSSHQLGIEADIWLRPKPIMPFSPAEIEEVLSTDLVRADGKDINPKVYKPQHLAVLRAAASQPEVARVFVNPAIKKALCRDAVGDRSWLRKVRPAAGHTYHFHIRLACPKDATDCIDQDPPGDGDGCGKEVDSWLVSPKSAPKPTGVGKVLSLSALPPLCRTLVNAPVATK